MGALFLFIAVVVLASYLMYCFYHHGFHRVYTLRKKGITKIPVVVQNIGNPNLDMPPSILGLDRSYLLGHPRPVLVKDFFNSKLTTVLKLKKTVTTVKVQWGVEKSGMAV